MHVELVLPGLFGAQAPAPAAELLLARGRREDEARRSLERWLGHAFGLVDDMPPAGALGALACGLAPGTDDWVRADPVHLHASQEGVRLLPAEGFALPAAEADSLVAALNAHFADDFTLHALRPGAWAMQLRRDMEVRGRAPIEIAGRGIHAALPDRRVHALMNEIQMALHQHPVNAAREARGDPAVNGLWLWGSGRLQERPVAPWASVSADNLVALGLARQANVDARAPGDGAAAWLERAPREGRHLVVLEDLRAPRAMDDAAALAAGLRAIEERWFAPLLAALRADRIGMLSVHVPDAGFRSETVRGELRRFWRRTRPLAAYAPLDDGAGP